MEASASGSEAHLQSHTFQHASLEGKVAVITGSTQGLGEATARLFVDRGIEGLIVTGRNRARGEAVAASLTTAKNNEGISKGCTAIFVQADLSSLDDCRKIIQAADDNFGKLHILVNAAAWTARGSLWDTTPELYDEMIAINARAPFFLMQDAIRIMERESIEGSIVNISSTASYGSMPMLAPYAISKGALNVTTKHFAYAVMRSRIRVNALAIGWMNTPGEDAVQREYHQQESGAAEVDWKTKACLEQPFGRLLDPEEVARCIAYCASNESGLMTGCVIDFDQSVWGGGPAPVPPPKEEYDKADGVKFSFD